MTYNHADKYPDHDRLSCAEVGPCYNASADGTGCRRCTALELDNLALLRAYTNELRAALTDMSVQEKVAVKRLGKLSQQHDTGLSDDTLRKLGTVVRWISKVQALASAEIPHAPVPPEDDV